ncbi:MAG: ester cyclase [Verrucomicrobiota bacterium]
MTLDQQEANKALMREFIDVVQNQHDLEAIDRFFSPDFVNYTIQPPFPKNREGSTEVHRALFAGIPDLKTVIDDLAADGDKVWTYKTMSGTHAGDLYGIPPTGQAIRFKVIDIMTIQNGKITEHWHVTDLGQLLDQLRAEQ